MQARQFHNTGNSVSFTLAGRSAKSYIRLFYPFVPFKQWNTTDEIVLEKLVEGAPAARTVLRVSNNDKLIDDVSEFRISVRNNKVTAYRNGVELLAAEDKNATPLAVATATISANCWSYAIKGFTVTAAGGNLGRQLLDQLIISPRLLHCQRAKNSISITRFEISAVRNSLRGPRKR